MCFVLISQIGPVLYRPMYLDHVLQYGLLNCKVCFCCLIQRSIIIFTGISLTLLLKGKREVTLLHRFLHFCHSQAKVEVVKTFIHY